MGESNSNIADDILRFLEQEREIYGDFTPSLPDNLPAEKTEDSPEPKEKEATQSQPEPEPKPEAPKKPLTLNERLNACSTLDELRELCEQADDLKTDLENTNLVFGVGNPSADLMLIGEAPGEQEDKKGEPFVGPAGQLLNKILAAINFDRDDVYIANILKHRPPGNRNPNEEERQRSLPYLHRQIDLIRPKVILCLGKVSATTLLEKDQTLGSMRGRFYDFRGTKLTVTYHPAALLRNQKWKRPTWEDVQMVREKCDELVGS